MPVARRYFAAQLTNSADNERGKMAKVPMMSIPAIILCPNRSRVLHRSIGRQKNASTCAFTQLAGDFNGSAMSFHDLLRDRQPKATTLLRRLRGDKHSKNFWQYLGGIPMPVSDTVRSTPGGLDPEAGQL